MTEDWKGDRIEKINELGILFKNGLITPWSSIVQIHYKELKDAMTKKKEQQTWTRHHFILFLNASNRAFISENDYDLIMDYYNSQSTSSGRRLK